MRDDITLEMFPFDDVIMFSQFDIHDQFIISIHSISLKWNSNKINIISINFQ